MNFSMDIPADWRIEQDGTAYRFLHPSNDCIINVMVDDMQGIPYNEMVIALYQSLNGQNAHSEGQSVSFDMIDDKSIVGKVSITAQGSAFTTVSAVGQCMPFQNILSSIVRYDSNKKAIENAGNVAPILNIRPAPKVHEAVPEQNKKNNQQKNTSRRK